MNKKNDEYKRMTTREDEKALKDKNKVAKDEFEENVPPDQPPSDEVKKDLEGEKEVPAQKDKKRYSNE